MTQTITFGAPQHEGHIEQIHRLNHRVFAEEIPQHPRQPDGKLVDRFHDENTHIIATRGEEVIGMVCYRGERPFSLDHKLPDLDRYLPEGRRVCEVRLLATIPEARTGIVFRGLIETLARRAVDDGYTSAVISGTVRQAKLYRHLGFLPFGPLVGTPEAPYQPMILSLSDFLEHRGVFSALSWSATKRTPRSFLPGPVDPGDHVRAALNDHRPIWHRSDPFRELYDHVAARLRSLTQAPVITMALGSGTLANDLVGGQISTWGTPGLILSNGAFGERLVDHAKRWGLPAEALKQEWGSAFTIETINEAIESHGKIHWIWFVHGETSTGVVNDLEMLKKISRERSIDLCADCVSTLGTVPMDLRGIRLASSVSGKGLSSLPGVAIVASDRREEPSSTLPRYLDLGWYHQSDGIPFTFPSTLLEALYASLDHLDPNRRYDQIRSLHGRLMEQAPWIEKFIVAQASPFLAVVTLRVPESVPATVLARQLVERGVEINDRSGYLTKRNWVQIAFMGHQQVTDVDVLAEALTDVWPSS